MMSFSTSRKIMRRKRKIWFKMRLKSWCKIKQSMNPKSLQVIKNLLIREYSVNCSLISRIKFRHRINFWTKLLMTFPTKSNYTKLTRKSTRGFSKDSWQSKTHRPASKRSFLRNRLKISKRPQRWSKSRCLHSEWLRP